MRTPKLQLDAQAMERRMRKVGTTKDADVVAALLADNADLRRQVRDLEELLRREEARA